MTPVPTSPAVVGNPPPFTGDEPFPPHIPAEQLFAAVFEPQRRLLGVLTTNGQIRAAACVWMDWYVSHRGRLIYTQTAARSRFFDHKLGTLPQECDCSQFGAGLLYHSGVTQGLRRKAPLDHHDYTGTLLDKGKHLTAAEVRAGDGIVYGGGTGTHFVLVRERISATDFWTVGFGHQGGPDRVRHSDLVAYFRPRHPGVTFLAFLL